MSSSIPVDNYGSIEPVHDESNMRVSKETCANKSCIGAFTLFSLILLVAGLSYYGNVNFGENASSAELKNSQVLRNDAISANSDDYDTNCAACSGLKRKACRKEYCDLYSVSGYTTADACEEYCAENGNDYWFYDNLIGKNCYCCSSGSCDSDDNSNLIEIKAPKKMMKNVILSRKDAISVYSDDYDTNCAACSGLKRKACRKEYCDLYSVSGYTTAEACEEYCDENGNDYWFYDNLIGKNCYCCSSGSCDSDSNLNSIEMEKRGQFKNKIILSGKDAISAYSDDYDTNCAACSGLKRKACRKEYCDLYSVSGYTTADACEEYCEENGNDYWFYDNLIGKNCYCCSSGSCDSEDKIKFLDSPQSVKNDQLRSENGAISVYSDDYDTNCAACSGLKRKACRKEYCDLYSVSGYTTADACEEYCEENGNDYWFYDNLIGKNCYCCSSGSCDTSDDANQKISKSVQSKRNQIQILNINKKTDDISTNSDDYDTNCAACSGLKRKACRKEYCDLYSVSGYTTAEACEEYCDENGNDYWFYDNLIGKNCYCCSSGSCDE